MLVVMYCLNNFILIRKFCTLLMLLTVVSPLIAALKREDCEGRLF